MQTQVIEKGTVPLPGAPQVTRWKELEKLTGAVVDMMMAAQVPGGLDCHFFNRPKVLGVTDRSMLASSFDKVCPNIKHPQTYPLTIPPPQRNLQGSCGWHSPMRNNDAFVQRIQSELWERGSWEEVSTILSKILSRLEIFYSFPLPVLLLLLLLLPVLFLGS